MQVKGTNLRSWILLILYSLKKYKYKRKKNLVGKVKKTHPKREQTKIRGGKETTKTSEVNKKHNIQGTNRHFISVVIHGRFKCC